MRTSCRSFCVAFVLASWGISESRADERVPAIEVKGSPAVARIGSRTISRRELDDRVNRAMNSRFYHANVSAEKKLEIERAELEALVRLELDFLGGIDRGLPLPLAEARDDRAKIEATLGESEYERSIELNGWTRVDHVRILAENRLKAISRQKFVTERAKVGDDEARKAYEAHKERWTKPEALHVEHILLGVPPDSPAESWEKRRLEAIEVAEKLRGGTSFSELAAARSSDMYRIKGGDLGWVHRGRLIEPVETAAWLAKENELTGPLRSGEGFHVFRVVAKRAAEPMKWEDVLPKLRSELQAKRLEVVEREWYGELSARYAVEVLEPALRPGRKG